MLSRLVTRVITIVPRRTKVLRPAFPRVNPGPVHYRAPERELKLWVCIIFTCSVVLVH